MDEVKTSFKTKVLEPFFQAKFPNCTEAVVNVVMPRGTSIQSPDYDDTGVAV